MRSRIFLLSASVIVLLIMACVVQEPAVRQPITSDLQGWADFNQDGFLDGPEIEQLVRAFSRLASEPHEVMYPPDEFFDLNGDGHVGPREVEISRHLLFGERMAALFDVDPEAAGFLDLNENRRIDEPEIGMLWDFLFLDPRLREPHRVTNPLDKRLDGNRDERVDGREIADGMIFLILAATRIPVDMGRLERELMALREELGPDRREEPREEREPGFVAPVRSFLDELADINEDGRLNREEIAQMEEGLGGPHRAETEFDRRIDVNENGKVEAFEIAKARRAAEIEEPGMREEAPREFPVRTLVDKQLDLNEDGVIAEDEIIAIVEFFLRGTHETDRFNRLDTLADDNRNGLVSEEEMLILRERYVIPHPVDPEVDSDRKLDTNKDRFVSPEEIGIVAGVTEFGDIPPVEELVEQFRLRQERELLAERPREIERADEELERPREEEREPVAEDTDTDTAQEEEAAEETVEVAAVEAETAAVSVSGFQKKLDFMQDKKVAVVSLNANTKTVDEETVDGIMVFIENAFVNIGKVKVVDRQNLENILTEYEFQQTDLTDQSTAVQVGKLSGADSIVIGSVSLVGKKYYLNIKLISVETGEIQGSSIADAASDSEFFDMCNNAVYKLF
jgi:hypothetical protein